MYLNSQRIAFSIAVFSIAVFSATDSFGQYGSRSQMVRQAQQRGVRPSYQQGPTTTRPTRVAQGSGTRNPGTPMDNTPVQSTPNVNGSSPIIGGPSSGARGYTPMHLSGNTANQVISEGPIVEGGSPIISDGYFEDDGSVMLDDGSCGCGDAGCCGDCGVGQCYFDPCCGKRNGGCCPECWENCWLRGFGGIFRNSEWYVGAAAFRSRNFTINDEVLDDSSFGYYGGVNLGLPLCYLTCGLFSGQIGVRTVQSEFDGNQYTSDNRDQLFVTGGFFRRVDYGLQLGVVGDYLRDNWFAETELAQIRGDVAWLYPNGSAFGFRFATGTQNDDTIGIVNGQQFTNLSADVIDNYRFYYRFVASGNGFVDSYVGWSDNNHAVFGVDFDTPVCGRWAMQSGFTYLLPDNSENTMALATEEAWNIYVGLSFRPQGACWYCNYDRPLFNVADNGSFIFGRGGGGRGTGGTTPGGPDGPNGEGEPGL